MASFKQPNKGFCKRRNKKAIIMKSLIIKNWMIAPDRYKIKTCQLDDVERQVWRQTYTVPWWKVQHIVWRSTYNELEDVMRSQLL